MLQLPQALGRLEDFLLGVDDLLEDGTLPHLDGLLLQIAHPSALGQQHAAIIGVFTVRDDVQKGGLAGTVGSYQGQTVIFF